MPSLAPPVALEPDPYTGMRIPSSPCRVRCSFVGMIEYAAFLDDSFDPNSFSSTCVNASGENGDVSAALAKLNFGAEEITRQLKSQVNINS